VRTLVDEGPALGEPLRAVLAARQRGAAEVPRSVTPGPAAPSTPAEPLTEREREVLVLLAAGKSTRQIAGELVVTAGTVKTHLTHLYHKLDAHSRTQALARARELALP
jgi:ATP/maltotriose-dependent transcriptional regulator MalT